LLLHKNISIVNPLSDNGLRDNLPAKRAVKNKNSGQQGGNL
jgi:hypothetical protein